MSPQSQPVLLITRPLGPAQRFGQAAAQRFPHLGQIISPLLAVRFLAPAQPIPRSSAVIFTSETGVAAAINLGVHLGAGTQTAYCVGAQTARAATAGGFTAICAEGDWQDLARLILRHPSAKDLLLLCAAEAPPHLQQHLAQQGKTVQRINVYAQDAAPFTPPALAALHGTRAVIAPLFSPRSAQIFARAALGCTAPILVAAFSGNVAAALRDTPLGHAPCEIADRPNSAAMLDAIAKLIERHGAAVPNP